MLQNIKAAWIKAMSQIKAEGSAAECCEWSGEIDATSKGFQYDLHNSTVLLCVCVCVFFFLLFSSAYQYSIVV
jgi:hypothetical protein